MLSLIQANCDGRSKAIMLIFIYPNGGVKRPARKSSKADPRKPYLRRGHSNGTVQVLIVKKLNGAFLTGGNLS